MNIPRRSLSAWGRLPIWGGALFLLSGASAISQQYHLIDVTPTSIVPAGRLTAATRGRQVGGGPISDPAAYLFTGNSITSVSLTPFGYWAASALAISSDGQQQCGWGTGFALSNEARAVMWSSSAASFVELGASGYPFSYCTGIDNSVQVGFARNSYALATAQHAYLWRGSVFTAVDLHPATVTPFSRANAIRGNDQVGYISNVAYSHEDQPGFHTTSRAYRWSGTAASAVSLHPAGFDASEAIATNGTQQGGWGYLAGSATPEHALIWTGAAASVTDLHPAGFTTSRVNALSTTMQAGEGWVGTPFAAGSVRHALAWSGTNGSVVDLNAFLPAGYTHALATGIDEDGNVVGYAYNDTSSAGHGAFAPGDSIALIFAPGPGPAVQLSSVVADPAPVAPGTIDQMGVSPGTVVNITVNLSAPAPAGGTALTFRSTNLNLAATPASLVIPEGASSATFPLPTFMSVAYRTSVETRIYATDGGNSKFASVVVTPVVTPASISAPAVEGGFATTGTVTLKVPAQGTGAVVSLASGNPALVVLPATVTVAKNFTTATFPVSTTAVAAATSVPFTATFNGVTVSGSVSLSPAPALTLTSLNVPSVVGGKTTTGSVTLNTFPRAAAGAVVSLVSSDAGTLPVPATVTVPQGATVVNFPIVSKSTSTLKTVTVTATLNGSTATTVVTVNPTPTVTISQADFALDTMLLKIHADTSYLADSVLTFGVDGGGPIGTLQFELGTFKASMVLATAPRTVTVWNSNGGQATLKVTVTGAGGGGGGGGGTATYKISVSKNGKGSVTASPAAASYAPGTVVTLTATPDPGSPWVGWGGACSGTAATCTLTMNSDLSVTANFR